jgi:glutamate racemase
MTVSKKISIGLFDSGLGGLTVLRGMLRALPSSDYFYLGDNARFPYGTKGNETIIRYARECARFLLSRQVGILIVACNTASAAALHALENELSIPVIGTVGPAVRQALRHSQSGSIGVLGTNATIASGVYQRSINAADATATVRAQACPLFVPLVEAGMLRGEIVDKVVELYLTPLKDRGVDTVILGCTHYPLLIESIQAFMGPEVSIVECSEAIAKDVVELLGERAAPATPGSVNYFVTDEVGRFNYLASAFLEGQSVNAVRIDSL